jgi:(R,R)-butanediol dehydrogenase / meso-butanediol dehydrogenase / diacetyl reductase
MLAVRWHGRGDVRVEDIPPPPPPGSGEVQLRVSWCGICGTDMEEMRNGPIFVPVDEPHPITGRKAPLTLGHEFSGVVDSTGPGVDDLHPGDRVAVDAIVFCGTCYWCRRNEVVRCDLMGSLGQKGDGGLAELCNAPARMCLPVPEGVSGEAASMAETLSVAVRALRRGRMEPGDRVAVVGGGAVGLMALQAALALGAASVDVVEPMPERRRLAEELGAARAVEGPEGLQADVAVEAAGNARAAETAVASLRKGGRAVLVGIHRQPLTIQPLDMVLGETEVVGSLSHVYDEDFRVALSLLGRGAVRAEPVISDRIPLERAVEDGIRALAEEPQKHLKIVVGAGGWDRG